MSGEYLVAPWMVRREPARMGLIEVPGAQGEEPAGGHGVSLHALARDFSSECRPCSEIRNRTDYGATQQ